jgi:hypothetical protein
MLPKQENYQLARRMAVEGLAKADLQDRAARGGGRYEPGPGGESRVALKYLGHEILISFPNGSIAPENGQGPIPLREEILVLHYLTKAAGAPAAGQWISFAEVPGGAFYHPVFLKRCQWPLVKFFGGNPEVLKSAAEELGGEPLGFGDVGIKVPAFPFVPLGLVLWRGDEEFPADGNFLFDASVSEYLPVEDIVILAETVVWKLIKNRR